VALVERTASNLVFGYGKRVALRFLEGREDIVGEVFLLSIVVMMVIENSARAADS